MQFRIPSRTSDAAHPGASRRWLGGSLLTSVLLALAASACGSSDPSPTILNSEKVERAIERSSLTQRGAHVQVSCPAGVHQQRGLTFSCTAISGSDRTRFVVTQVDGSGRVHYEAP